MAKHRRTFTPEFKAQAVKLVTEQGRSVAEVARDLDLSEGLLRSWKQALTVNGPGAFPGRGNLPVLEDELRRLRAENKRLQMGRDILKKATAFFARESS
jgi:transposase